MLFFHFYCWKKRKKINNEFFNYLINLELFILIYSDQYILIWDNFPIFHIIV